MKAMDLELTEEQQLLRETVRGLCARHAGLDVVRQLEDDAVGYPEKFWLQLGEAGVLDLREATGRLRRSEAQSSRSRRVTR